MCKSSHVAAAHLKDVPRFSQRCGALALAVALAGVVLSACSESEPDTKSDGTADSSEVSAPAAPALSPAKIHRRDVSEAQIFWKELNASAVPCDEIAPFVSKAIARDDVYNLYTNAKIGSENCRAAANKIGDTALPEHASDEVNRGLKEALKSDAEAYSDNSEGYSRMEDMANGGPDASRPSEIENFRQITEESHLYLLKAVLKFADAFSKEGVKPIEYTDATPKSGHHHHRSRDQ